MKKKKSGSLKMKRDMKKTFYAGAAVLMLAACTRETPYEVSENTESPRMVEVTLKATIESDDDTKATIADDGVFTWNKDDEIAVFTKNGNLVTLKAEADGSTSDFKGEVAEDDAIVDGSVAYYPASIAVGGNAAQVNLPSSYESADAARKGFVMRAVSSGDQLSFKHMGALLKVTAHEIPASVTAVSLTVSKNATGAFDVSVSDEIPSIAAGSSSSTITITTSSADREGTSSFWFPLPVMETEGFSVKFLAGSDVISEKATTKTLNLPRKKLVRMAAFIVTGEESDYRIALNYEIDNAVPMYNVLGHEGWYVAQSVSIVGLQGSKFITAGSTDFTDAWGAMNSNGGSSYAGKEKDSPHKVQKTYATLKHANSSGFKLAATGKYDVYFNPTEGKCCFLNPGDPWGKTIYVVDASDDKFSPYDQDGHTYFLHVWASGYGDATIWKEHTISNVQDINGIRFLVSEHSVDNDYLADDVTYNMIIGKDGNSLYGNINNILTTTKGVTEYGVHLRSSKSYQVADIDNPVIKSRYSIMLNGKTADESVNTMLWDGTYLFLKDLALSSDVTRFETLYKGDWTNRYGGNNDGTAYAVGSKVKVVDSGTISSINLQPISDGTVCDFYLDVKNDYMYILPQGMTPAQYEEAEAEKIHITIDGDFSDWAKVEATPGRSDAPYDGIQSIKAYGDSDNLYVYLEVKAASLNLESGNQYANYGFFYLGNGEGTSNFWGWTTPYDTYFQPWFVVNGNPDFLTFNATIDKKVVVEDEIARIEFSLARSHNACLSGDSAYIGVGINQQYVQSDGSWAGTDEWVGFAPATGGEMLKVNFE
ncbi:MAG: hypothetical protein IJ721_03720 [Bacteroidales bacterium]|nr:hypothetical protein [Bacteroidales bacterium]